jgi:DNA modification methylase
MNIDLRLGDCLEVLKTIPDNSIDSVVTDPPYHLTSIVKRFGKEDSAPAQFGTDGAYARASKGFMGKEWDGGDIAFRTDVWSECLRVLKPGGHLLAFSHSRTYHRMGVAIEDAGFEIRDQIMWVYGSGFPKSHNIGKAIDKIEGNDREVVGEKKNKINLNATKEGDKSFYENAWQNKDYIDLAVTKGNSEWEGWGTALKPAHEPIVMARKPLSEKSIAENVLKHGTGGINIDGSRIGFRDESDKESAKPGSLNATGEHSMFGLKSGNELNDSGRFPANIIFDEEAGQLLDEQSGVKQYNKGRQEGNYKGGHRKEYVGTENNEIVNKVEGKFFNDKGGASRFFYCPKAAKKDRGEGIELINNHPTVKPTDLMRYLINLITPPNGTILDPFMGSGSTGKAAVRCGVNFIGIEKEQEYMDISKARIEHEKNKPVQGKLL